MSVESFIIEVFCLVSDWMSKKPIKLRSRGPNPSLDDSEVLTMEIVGEFLGMDQDKKIHSYFKTHWAHFFPGIGDRTAFARQSANLWGVKKQLQKYLSRACGALEDDIHIVDGFPFPICNFRRAHFSKLYRGEASYGYCAAKNQTYYGFKGHLLISVNGVICDFEMAPAHIDEREVALNFTDTVNKNLLGDKGYIGKQEEFCGYGINLQTPLRSNMCDSRPRENVRILNNTRRRIETVIGQLVDRLNIEKNRARDLWHLTSRTWRKLLTHTVAAILSKKHCGEWLKFDALLN